MKVELTTAQKEAIESIDKSMLVTAGAGSGKTLVLVRRFVEILQKQPELTVHNLLAVTYTRKAAKEMRTRIKARLKELYEGASNKKEQMRWHQCLADMDSALIDTIHSLCQSILRAFTVDIGIDPQIEVLDEIEKAQIVQESIDETLRQTIVLQSSSNVLLEHFSLEIIEGFLQIALKNHLQFAQLMAGLEPLDSAGLSAQLDILLTRTQKQLLKDLALDQDWHQAGNFIKTSAATDKLEDMRIRTVQHFNDIQDFVESFVDDQETSVDKASIKQAWQSLLDLKNIGPLRTTGGNSENAKEMRAAIKRLIEKSKDYSQTNRKGYGLPVQIPQEENGNSEQYWLLWQDLLSIGRLAQSIYAAKKMELGKLDFDDLIAKVSSILKAPGSSIRKHYNKTLDHILVDEFQDTNPIQAEIISLLADEKTTLFLIGDDKQSIYKFQGADVSTFNVWQRKSSNILAFEHSFRSQSSIVDFVNSIFSVLLPAKSAHVDYRAKYSPLIAQRDASSFKENPQAHVEIIQLASFVHNEESNIQLSKQEIEGKAVAKWIYNKVQTGAKILGRDGKERSINYGDFAVLTSRNRDLQTFESSLSELDIPYASLGGRNFLKRQEIYDLENMLLFLSNPSDSHALLAILRSPMFGLSDDLIHNLFSGNGETLWQSMQRETEKLSNKNNSASQLLSEAIIILKRLLADLPVLSLSALVYRIIRETNYDLIVLTLPDGKQRYKNIWKFYMLAQDDLLPAQFAERLELSRQLSVELTNATIDSQQSVKLMTIHNAKGLEFPAVALPALSIPSSMSNKNKLLFHNQFGIVLNTTRTEQEREEELPLPYLLGKTLDDDMDVAEKKRLLYVAMTRARDYLGLFIEEGGEKKESAASWLAPLILEKSNPHSVIYNFDLDPLSGENTDESLPLKTNKYRTDKKENSQLDQLLSPVWRTKNSEQLLESVAEHLGMPAIQTPEVSSLAYRITPSRLHAEANPILIGKFFHRIMEYLPKDKTSLEDIELTILAEQFGEEVVHPVFKETLITEGKKLIGLYAKSKLRQMLSSAKTICHEWSYYMSSDTEKLYLNRPDLLIETADGQWYLIDYKTDRFDVRDIERQVSRHRSQLEKYKEDFDWLTKIQTKLAIYFAQHGILHEL